MTAHWTTQTPAGSLTIVAEADAVVAAGFTTPAVLLGRLGRGALPVDDLGAVSRAVEAYLGGDPAALAAVPTRQHGTPFQEEVWAALAAIPPGRTASYGELAAAVGRPRAVRAVGAACGRNLIAPFVPCHRAVRSDGSHGGYEYGLAVKGWLLAHEARVAAAG